MTLGQRISQNRKQLGLSQEALGERLGVSRQAVSKWETGAASPDMENLLALAKEFGISVAALTETPEAAATPEAPAAKADANRRWWAVLGILCALILFLAGLVIYWYINAIAGQESKTPEPPGLPTEQPLPAAAPETDFALLWYGTNGDGEFLELGEQETFFPFGTTLELTAPAESMHTDFGDMTAHRADCGAIGIGYYHLTEEPERESVWSLSTIVSGVRTPRGVHPGSTKSQVLDAYGDELVYCMKEEGGYTLVSHDYYYAFQTPETFGASLQFFMQDGIVAGIRVEHMAELGSEAFAPNHITRFPLKDGEPDYSQRQEPESEPRSDTWKIYHAWNQLVTNNNLSAEEQYTYHWTIFSGLSAMDWQEFGSYGFGGTTSESYESTATIEALMSWLYEQAPYTDAEVFQIQMGCMSKGLDGAYADMYCHLLSTALFTNPVGFVKGLAADSVEDTMSRVLHYTAYDAELYPADTSIVLSALHFAEVNGHFKERELDWSKLLQLYLSTPMGDRTSLPATP